MDNDLVLTRQNTSQQRAIAYLARQLFEHYITKENIYLLLIAGTREQLKALKTADILYRSIQSSLQFNQCRRATWYLGAYSRLCRQLFCAKHLSSAHDRLNKWTS